MRRHHQRISGFERRAVWWLPAGALYGSCWMTITPGAKLSHHGRVHSVEITGCRFDLTISGSGQTQLWKTAGFATWDDE